MTHNETYLLLHNIRSAYNVGSIFRTADAAGVSKLFLTGYTPTPVDRHGRKRNDLAKTALGAEDSVAWEYIKDPGDVIDHLHQGGVTVIGVEQDKRAVAFNRYQKPRTGICWVLGNEVRGLSATLRDRCDALVEIPMKGEKESLNVGVAAGIILFSGR